MSKFAFVIAQCVAVLVISTSSSAAIRLNDVTADGTWDCKDSTGVNTGTIVLAETTYAFIKPDGKLGGYGKLHMTTEDLDLPAFAMLGGYMKDVVKSFGFGMRGPKGNPHELSGELYLNVVMSVDGKQDWDCVRRVPK